MRRTRVTALAGGATEVEGAGLVVDDGVERSEDEDFEPDPHPETPMHNATTSRMGCPESERNQAIVWRRTELR